VLFNLKYHYHKENIYAYQQVVKISMTYILYVFN